MEKQSEISNKAFGDEYVIWKLQECSVQYSSQTYLIHELNLYLKIIQQK